MGDIDRIQDLISETVHRILNEGIEFDVKTKTVSYNPDDENNVDTSLRNNPTLDDEIIPYVPVWSIFKRKIGEQGDGNPLVYAMKGERGWHFKTNKDERLIDLQINKIASKFATMYPIGVTIVIPSGNYLNQKIANVVMSKSQNTILVKGAIRKMTTVEVNDIVMDFNSKFRQYYGDDFNDSYYRLCEYLKQMDEKRDGMFTRHFIRDNKMRNILDFTLKATEDPYARFAKQITGQEVLVIDDTISRGQTIKEACKIIQDTYAPKSITVLTLLSKLYQ